MEACSDSDRAELLELLLIEARIGVAARLEHWAAMPNDTITGGRSVTANLEWVLGGLLDLPPGKEKALLRRVRENQLIEVRCGSEATRSKLLGWLEVPRGTHRQEYDRVRLVKNGGYVELQLRRCVVNAREVPLNVPGVAGVEVELETRLAFFTRESTLQELRQVREFLENRSPWP